MCSLMVDPKKGMPWADSCILDTDGKEVIWAG